MYQGKKIIQIVARGLKGEIGANNKLLWNISEDLQFFKESTLGHVVLMGRKTYENLPNKLSRRIVLSVTRKPFKDDCGFGSNFERDLESYLQEARHCCDEILNTSQIFIAGGSKLFNTTFDLTDELWITQIEKEYPEADTFYLIPSGFKMIEEVYGDRCEDVGIGYSFQKWVRV